MIALLAALILAQDSEERYREALYQEVDKGDLDKAIELYRKVDADSSVAESVRAKAAFRLAWCLEKKGKKVDAERAYRDAMSRYASQEETVAKARERLERLVSGNGGTTHVSMDERVAGLILELGAKEPMSALRTLVLIGDTAIPALRQALAHKDPSLSALAACALARLEQDGGTFAPMVRGLKEGDWTRNDPERELEECLEILLRRQEGYRKDFVALLKKIEDPLDLRPYFRVARVTKLRELDDRMRQIVLTGPIEILSDALSHLAPESEDVFLKLLQDIAKSPQAGYRAVHLAGWGKVKDVPAYAKAVLAIFPDGPEGQMSSHVLQSLGAGQVLQRLRDPVDHQKFYEEFAPVWLKAKRSLARDVFVQDLTAQGVWAIRLWATLLPTIEDRNVKGDLIEEIADELERVEDEETLAAVEKEFVREIESPKAGGWVLLKARYAIRESHPKWELYVKRSIELLDPNDFDKLFGSRSEAGQKRIRRLVNEALTSGTPELRLRALELIARVGDDTRFEALATLALDEKQEVKLRISALSRLRADEVPQATIVRLVPLAKTKDPDLKRLAVSTLAGRRAPEIDAAMEGLVRDEDAEIARVSVGYFANQPRLDQLDPLFAGTKHKESAVRKRAVEGLSKTESMKAVPYLIALLEDDNAGIRTLARNGLEAIKKHHDEIEQWRRWYEGVREKK